MAAIRAAKAKMELVKAGKKAMTEYVNLCNSDNCRAELFGTTVAMALETLYLAAQASGAPSKVNLVHTSPADKAWMNTAFVEMLKMWAKGELVALSEKIRQVLNDKTHEGTYMLGCLIGSAAEYLNVETYRMELMAGAPTVEQVAKISATCVMADCNRMLKRL
jgi:hypothetical protein